MASLECHAVLSFGHPSMTSAFSRSPGRKITYLEDIMKNLSPPSNQRRSTAWDGSIVSPRSPCCRHFPITSLHVFWKLKEAELNGLISSGVLMRPHQYISDRIGYFVCRQASIDVVEARGALKISTGLGVFRRRSQRDVFLFALTISPLTTMVWTTFMQTRSRLQINRDHSISVELLDKVQDVPEKKTARTYYGCFFISPYSFCSRLSSRASWTIFIRRGINVRT